MKSSCCSKRIFRTGVLIAASGFWAVSGSGCAHRSGSAEKIAPAPEIPPTLLMDGRRLVASKQRILAGAAALQPAYSNLLKDAEKAMAEGPFSVMNKHTVPPSGDKHDYTSLARYWWPDSSKPDGLPYIQRDGITNPDSQGPNSDYTQLSKLASSMEALGMAYYLTGEECYAERAALLLRTWFLAPETHMNPNLNFPQAILGRDAGRKTGVLDGRKFNVIIDGIVLISDSPALSAEEKTALHAWFSEYLNWLKTNKLAQDESASKNNHGTFFDVQIVHVALFAGDIAYAKQVAEAAIQKRILAQIKADGSQPEELARPISLHYSFYNLEAMFYLATLAGHAGVDLWHAGDSRIRTALDFVAPYSDPARPWPYKDIDEASRMRLFPLLLQAADVYQDESYRRMVEKLPLAERKIQRENLVVPLMN
ncbi:MAG: alginate lyase family protein [Kiritimatiellales bacterium]